jgi:hypothetical protein
MDLVFVDYTPPFFTAMAKTPVPPVVGGKFVQIKNEETEYLVFSPKEFTKYHAGIVERFCLDKGMEGGYDSERKRFDIFDRAWIVSGGGKFELDRGRMTVRLYDESMAYGKFDRTGMAEKVLSLPEFAGFTVLID